MTVQQQQPCVNRVSVRVPATTANLGAGFDTYGLALDYYDDLTFTRYSSDANAADATEPALADTSVTVEIEGEGEGTLPHDETHLVVRAFRQACERFGLDRFGFTLHAFNRIPQARGMGSSAEAIVAGVSAAYAFAHAEVAEVADGADTAELHTVGLDRDVIFEVAAAIEGHPDNVAPAVYGGLTASWKDEHTDTFHTVSYGVDERLQTVVFVPDYELSTQAAREALPASVPYADAVFNVSRASLLPAALNPTMLTKPHDINDLLFTATQDTLHQPYRSPLMQPSADLIAKLRDAGLAAAVSGAGPCVFVAHYGDDLRARAEQVAAEELESGHWKALWLLPDMQGVQVKAA